MVAYNSAAHYACRLGPPNILLVPSNTTHCCSDPTLNYHEPAFGDSSARHSQLLGHSCLQRPHLMLHQNFTRFDTLEVLNSPFTPACCDFRSVVVPSACVSFLELPENKPETAPTRFRLSPACFTVSRYASCVSAGLTPIRVAGEGYDMTYTCICT